MLVCHDGLDFSKFRSDLERLSTLDFFFWLGSRTLVQGSDACNAAHQQDSSDICSPVVHLLQPSGAAAGPIGRMNHYFLKAVPYRAVLGHSDNWVLFHQPTVFRISQAVPKALILQSYFESAVLI